MPRATRILWAAVAFALQVSYAAADSLRPGDLLAGNNDFLFAGIA
jgi:hypothetical protein